MSYECKVREIEPQPYMSIRCLVPVSDFNSTLAEFFEEIWRYVEQMNGTVAGPPFSRVYQISEGRYDLEAGVPVRSHLAEKGRIRRADLPGGEAVFTEHLGPYEYLSEAESALDAWIFRNGRTAAAPSWHVYCTNPGEVADPDEWKTEIFKPLRALEG